MAQKTGNRKPTRSTRPSSGACGSVRKTGSRSFETLSEADAARAIYIDLEGFIGKAPTLIGILIEEHFEQVVLDPDLGAVASASGHRVSSFKDEARRVIDMARSDGRRVVAFTGHEREEFQRHAGVDFGGLYFDAHKIAVLWRRQFRPGIKRQNMVRKKWNSLKEFLKAIPYDRGSHLGLRESTSRIAAVKEMIVRKGSYDNLTGTVKGKWTKLCDHNRIDCMGMRELVMTAVRDFSRLGRRE